MLQGIHVSPVALTPDLAPSSKTPFFLRQSSVAARSYLTARRQVVGKLTSRIGGVRAKPQGTYCRATRLADAIAFALRFDGRKRMHRGDEYMAAIAAERVVRHLERAGVVVMKRPPEIGGAPLGRGFEG